METNLSKRVIHPFLPFHLPFLKSESTFSKGGYPFERTRRVNVFTLQMGLCIYTRTVYFVQSLIKKLKYFINVTSKSIKPSKSDILYFIDLVKFSTIFGIDSPVKNNNLFYGYLDTTLPSKRRPPCGETQGGRSRSRHKNLSITVF